MILIHLHLLIPEIVVLCPEIHRGNLIGGQRSNVHYIE